VFAQRTERLLKKQHRQALLLDNFLNIDGLAPGRSLRDRKPVTYTFGKQRKLMKHAVAIDLLAVVIDYSRHLLYFPITISLKVDFTYNA
jgi:hypothetical protein